MEKPSGASVRDSVGYLLIFVGVVIICACLFSGYQLFEGQTKPTHIFSLPGVSLDLSKQMAASLPPELQKQAAQQPSTPQELVSAQAINEPLNFFTSIFLLGFFASIGAKIAHIGVDLTRPYTIKQPQNVK